MTAKLASRSGTVYIVDDDASFLRSVSRFLTAVGYSVKAFESAQNFLNQLTADMTGCVVADLQMPGLNGLELQQALSKISNPLPIIFLSGQGDIPTTVKAMRSGAVDFLTKRAPKEAILAAIDQAHEQGAKAQQQRAREQGLRARFAELSQRELEVLSHVVRGEMNKEIASDLDINLRTVKLHRTSIKRKLDVQSVAELTRITDAAGLFKSQRQPPAK